MTVPHTIHIRDLINTSKPHGRLAIVTAVKRCCIAAQLFDDAKKWRDIEQAFPDGRFIVTDAGQYVADPRIYRGRKRMPATSAKD